MNLDRLCEIVMDSTSEYRKGPEVERRSTPGLDVVEVFAMPHVSDRPDTEKPYDLVFITVGVDRSAAERHHAELRAILDDWPDDRLKAGPSYIEVGGVVGSQDIALRLFALGEALGFWRVITPNLFGLSGEQAREAAGQGFVMISGYQPS